MRKALVVLWLAILGLAVYLIVFHRAETQAELKIWLSASFWWAAVVYFQLTVIRGIILIPAAPLLLVGIAIFPPWPLFGLTLAATMVSTVLIDKFPGFFHFEKLQGGEESAIERIKSVLTTRGLPVIMLWSFLPFTPTGMIVYACGSLRIPLAKTLLGVLVGSAAYYAIPIFSGDYLLRTWGWK